jgi:hypothetical protein
LNHFSKTLIEIDVSLDCRINNQGIFQLTQLKKINCSYNSNIRNLNDFSKLTEINIGGNCGVDDFGINKLLNLKKILAWDNPKITNLNCFVKTLTEINIGGNCGVTNQGIYEFSQGDEPSGTVSNLLIIGAYNNSKIKNLNFFKKLTKINVAGNCGVNDDGICELNNLLIIDANDNQKITDLNSFPSGIEPQSGSKN